jgi:3D (Asp-Asp-Asp) domain-containing protein
VGARYVVDFKEYKKENEKLSTYNQKLGKNYQNLLNLAQEIDQNSRKKSDKIMDLTEQLEKVENENKQLHKKNSDLKKSIKRKEVSSQRKLNMTVTAYVSNCVGCTGLTFTQYNVRNTIYYQGYRIVAADLNILPLYSIIEIQTKTSKFKAIVIDKGGLIRGNLLDLLVGSYDEATQFGRQNVKVKIIREGKGK